MDENVTFLIGLGISLTLSLAVVVYLRPHLQRVLLELCGTPERAHFWAAFSNVTIVLVPLICAMFHQPSGKAGATFFDVSTQIKWALIGLVFAVVVLGIVIGQFIPRSTRSGQAR